MDEPVTGGAPALIRVVLADDHAVVRAGLKSLLDAETDMVIVKEVGDGEAALSAAKELSPDVVVMDLSMPGVNGAEAARRIRAECPAVKVLALTVHEESVYVSELLRAGASGYVLKRAAAEELVRAVRAVAAGETYIDPSIAGAVVDGYVESELARPRPHDVLSDRERDVLIRIARGFSNKEIANELSLSIKTVETYKARMSEKLDLRTRAAIVRYAANQGWLGDQASE